MRAMPPYSVLVVWSREDQEYVATCPEIPGLSGLGPSEAAAVQELKVAIAGWLEYLESIGLPPPPEAGGMTISVGGDVRIADFPKVQAITESASSQATAGTDLPHFLYPGARGGQRESLG